MTAPDPEVLALARGVECVIRRLDTLDELVAQLATDVTALAARVAGPDPDDDTQTPRAWLLAQDPRRAAADLKDLVTWMERVYLRYPDAQLPSCWLWHPAVIEELWWLRRAHDEAYHPRRGGWQAVGDWHDRYRPGVLKRLTSLVRDCDLSLHLDGATTPGAPLADTADLIAHAWTSQPPILPIPSAAQLHDAEQHDDLQHQRHQRYHPA